MEKDGEFVPKSENVVDKSGHLQKNAPQSSVRNWLSPYVSLRLSFLVLEVGSHKVSFVLTSQSEPQTMPLS